MKKAGQMWSGEGRGGRGRGEGTKYAITKDRDIWDKGEG